MEKRVLALDVGEKRIGVAVSDPMGWTAQGVETIHCQGWRKDSERIGQLLGQYETDRLVVGLPRTLRGELGPQAGRIMEFADMLAGQGFQVRYQDERLTTSQAERLLIEGDVRREKRRQVVDKLAATYILQSFLDAGGWRESAALPRVQDVKVWKGGSRIMEDNKMPVSNIVELEDEDGKVVKFEYITTVQYEGEDYVLLGPMEPTEDMDEDEVLVLRIDNDADGYEIYVSVDDDDRVQKIFELYLAEVEEADEE